MSYLAAGRKYGCPTTRFASGFGGTRTTHAETLTGPDPPPRPASANRTSPSDDVRFPPDSRLELCHPERVVFDSDHVWRALEAKDPRFDGWFFCGVRTTGIYCRPSCPARTPKRQNVRFFPTAAAAQAAGLRACKRCRPDATPGSPEWDRRSDLIGRAMRLIADGVIDREGVSGLARRLGYTERHLHRQLVAVVGAGPLALARAQRAQTARVLLETTELPITHVAFAAGFGSVRQFNDTIREVFVAAPSALRANAKRNGTAADVGAISLRLPYRQPLDAEGVIAFFAKRAVPGIEEVSDGIYRRSLRLPHGAGIIELEPSQSFISARFILDDVRDLATAVQRSRALLDLDSDPQTVADVLASDPLLAPLIHDNTGRRVPGHVDPHELAVRAVLGQQVSVAGAATLAARLTAEYGEVLGKPRGGVTHLFPTADALAHADPAHLPMPQSRKRALLTLTSALACGQVEIDPGADRNEARRRLIELPGIGPWTAEYVAMRALRDPDAFLASDLGVRRALERLGRDGSAHSAQALAERWRPYRAYALQHLWGALSAQQRRPAAAAA
jgi:AraC family transcriptional regulator, regulatory protein of adaptative response / DNA-3-methyladenine glycosylase II